MPNRQNILAPITLVSLGRSGSSLLARAFEQHPEFSNAGETGNLIFSSWQALEFSNGVIPALMEDGNCVPNEVRASRIIRETLLQAVPAKAKYWFQKPVEIPTALGNRFDETEVDAAARWYWSVMKSVFPDGRFFTLLRCPCDVVLSAGAYWGYPAERVWGSFDLMARILLHPDSPVSVAIGYEDLVGDSRNTLVRLCNALDVPFDEAMLRAFSSVHVPGPDRDKVEVGRPSDRSQSWQSLSPADIRPETMRIIARLFERFAVPLRWPDHFVSGIGSASKTARPETDDGAENTRTIQDLQRELARVRYYYENEFRPRVAAECQEQLAKATADLAALRIAKANETLAPSKSSSD